MFDQETVFILGAGASWHYGYPTGEELVKRVIEKAETLSNQLNEVIAKEDIPWHLGLYLQENGCQNNKFEYMEEWRNQCLALSQRLIQTNTLVIDYFLKWCSELASIGKFMIAWEMLECESYYRNRKSRIHGETLKIKNDNNWNINREKINPVTQGYLSADSGSDDWYRFILHKLVYGCEQPEDLYEKNNVSFITFNYDISLEQSLFRGLSAIDFLNRESRNNFFQSRFVHIYGQVKNTEYESLLTDFQTNPPIPWKKSENGFWEKTAPFFHLASNVVSKSLIKTITDEKNDNELHLKFAREAIKKADNVYILGFGFDQENCKRIGLQDLLSTTPRENKKRIFFTNFQDRDAINKRVNNTFALTEATAESVFYTGSKSIVRKTGSGGYPMSIPFYERSTRNVYEALEMDFDFL
jgi:hypothetical protein